jgi:hypothetical protein
MKVGQSHPAIMGFVFLKPAKRRHHQFTSLVAVFAPNGAADDDVEFLLQAQDRSGVSEGFVPPFDRTVRPRYPFRLVDGGGCRGWLSW